MNKSAENSSTPTIWTRVKNVLDNRPWSAAYKLRIKSIQNFGHNPKYLLNLYNEKNLNNFFKFYFVYY